MKRLEKVSILHEGNKNILEYPECLGCRKPDIVMVPVYDGGLLDVNLSFDVPADKLCREKLVLLNCILGEGVGSKLQKYIREERCYTSNIASYIEQYQKFAILHIRFSVEKELLLPCLQQIAEILNDMKHAVSSKDLEVSLPFYTANRIFYEDDTEEMNFELAYHTFVLESEFGAFRFQNNDDTILALEKYAEAVFAENNMCLVIVGDTEKISKASILEIYPPIDKWGSYHFAL